MTSLISPMTSLISPMTSLISPMTSLISPMTSLISSLGCLAYHGELVWHNSKDDKGKVRKTQSMYILVLSTKVILCEYKLDKRPRGKFAVIDPEYKFVAAIPVGSLVLKEVSSELLDADVLACDPWLVMDASGHPVLPRYILSCVNATDREKVLKTIKNAMQCFHRPCAVLPWLEEF